VRNNPSDSQHALITIFQQTAEVARREHAASTLPEAPPRRVPRVRLFVTAPPPQPEAEGKEGDEDDDAEDVDAEDDDAEDDDDEVEVEVDEVEDDEVDEVDEVDEDEDEVDEVDEDEIDKVDEEGGGLPMDVDEEPQVSFHAHWFSSDQIYL
jgi:hypothetical protein